jgi:hypothetical protein
MTDRTDTHEEGRGSLRDHLPPLRAPAPLRQRIRGSLLSRGLLSFERRSPARWGILAAAAVLIFVAGIAVGRARSQPQHSAGAPSGTPKYALILYGGFEGDTGTAHTAREQEYGNWARSLSGDAKFVGGEELGRFVGEYTAQSELSAPTTGRVAGFFLIDASSDAIAQRIAKDCPHLKYGGRVLVQAVEM